MICYAFKYHLYASHDNILAIRLLWTIIRFCVLSCHLWYTWFSRYAIHNPGITRKQWNLYISLFYYEKKLKLFCSSRFFRYLISQHQRSIANVCPSKFVWALFSHNYKELFLPISKSFLFHLLLEVPTKSFGWCLISL